MKILNTGSTRIVILTDNYAIKIARFTGNDRFYGNLYGFLNGWKSNINEFRWS